MIIDWMTNRAAGAAEARVFLPHGRAAVGVGVVDAGRIFHRGHTVADNAQY